MGSGEPARLLIRNNRAIRRPTRIARAIRRPVTRTDCPRYEVTPNARAMARVSVLPIVRYPVPGYFVSAGSRVTANARGNPAVVDRGFYFALAGVIGSTFLPCMDPWKGAKCFSTTCVLLRIRRFFSTIISLQIFISVALSSKYNNKNVPSD